MTEKTPQTLEQFLEMLDTDMARRMLVDLADPDKRTPALYGAINKLLSRHEFTVKRLVPEKDVLEGLSDALEAYKAQTDSDGLTEADEGDKSWLN